MKFILLLLAISMQASAYSQLVTLNYKNAPLREVLKSIRQQTGYNFIVESPDLEKANPVTLNVKSEPIDKTLHAIFENQPFNYQLLENTIIIKLKLSKSVGEIHILKELYMDSIRGRVINERGDPIVGATIVVKRSVKGTKTKMNGEFFLDEVAPNSSIIVSSLSYLSQEIFIGNKTNLGQIILKPFVGILDEAVVIAYGMTTKRLQTGNVSTIKASDIEKQPINNPLFALQGRIPGLQITPNSGISGGPVSVQIRGRNTLGGALEGKNADPLFVVDGLPIINNINGLGGPSLSQFSALSFINPQDIESIDVLKDGDATSIYGSRGANGVILITTKKGKIGKTSININMQTGWSRVGKKINLLNTAQYINMRKEAFENSGIDISTQTPSAINADLTFWNQSRYTDWQKVLIGNTAKYSDAQVAFSGGTPNIQYSIGGYYHKETTVFPGENFSKKAGAHISLITTSQNERLKANVSTNYTNDYSNLLGTDFTNLAFSLAPNAPALYKNDGSLNWEPLPSGVNTWNNPFYTLNKRYDAKVNNLIANSEVSYKILSKLVIKAMIGYNQLTGGSFIRSFPFAGRNPRSVNNPANSIFNSNGVRNLSFEPQINYTAELFKGTITALIGGAIQNSNTEDQSITAIGFTSDALTNSLASATSYFALNNQSQYKYCALFGRLQYNWQNKYLLNLTARRDGSSRFGPGNQFGNFGSIGAAWIFTEEPYLRKELSVLSFGKLRFSFGKSGNDGVGDYKYLDRYQPTYGLNYQGVKGYASTGLFNAYYAWEVTRKMEIGLETGFFKDKVLFTASYFRNRSDNQLLSYPTPTMAGPGNPTYNLPALIQNTGLELTINTENIRTKDFSWKSSAFISINRNKLISFPNLQSSPYYNTYEIGQPFNDVVRAYKSAGVDPITGLYQFYSIDGKLTLTPEDPSRLDGGKYLRVMVGAKFYGGISNTFNYNGFSLDVFVQFTKAMGTNPLLQFNPLPGSGPNNQPVEVLSHWKKDGDRSDFQRISSTYSATLNDPRNRFANSDAAYVNTSFIRFKNIYMSYSIQSAMKKRTKLNDIKLFIQGQNLFTITSYKGFDPEVQISTTLPPLKTLTAGIQISL